MTTSKSTRSTTRAASAAAPKTVAKTVEDTVNNTKETVETAVKAGQDAVAKNIEQGLSFGREQFEKASTQMFSFWSDAVEYGKGNVDAYFAAGSAFAKGVEGLGRTVFDASQATIEDTVGATKAMVTAKSINEVVDLQGNYARKTFDGFVAEGTKLSEMTVKVANEAMAPINARVNVTVDNFARVS
ncbi:MAG: phasin family protein [Pseudomonadota bacterium]